jgi:hypothetical protein
VIIVSGDEPVEHFATRIHQTVGSSPLELSPEC